MIHLLHIQILNRPGKIVGFFRVNRCRAASAIATSSVTSRPYNNPDPESGMITPNCMADGTMKPAGPISMMRSEVSARLPLIAISLLRSHSNPTGGHSRCASYSSPTIWDSPQMKCIRETKACIALRCYSQNRETPANTRPVMKTVHIPPISPASSITTQDAAKIPKPEKPCFCFMCLAPSSTTKTLVVIETAILYA